MRHNPTRDASRPGSSGQATTWEAAVLAGSVAAVVAAVVAGGAGCAAPTTDVSSATTPAATTSTASVARSGPTSTYPSGTTSTPAPTTGTTTTGTTTTGAPAPTGPDVPPVSAAAQAAGLLDVRTVVPDAVIDLRYATTNNFTGVQIYPTGARCLVHQSMAAGLTEAARRLRAAGAVLVFWDCYRPHDAQIKLWDVVPDPAWVARPGPSATSHEAGRSVDVSLADAATHQLYDMGTGFDDFTPKATAYATAGLSAAQLANRRLLREAMAAGGLPIYAGEWWHFDGPGSKTPRPHLGAPVS